MLIRRCMDLHGLHVAEAVTVLDDQLAALSSKGLNSVRILAGSGHHSKGPTSKVCSPLTDGFRRTDATHTTARRHQAEAV